MNVTYTQGALVDLEDAYLHDGRKIVIWYTIAMSKEQTKEILDRVLTWPPERQADVVHVVELMEDQDKSELRLNDEQLAEVRRRRAKRNSTYTSLSDARTQFRDLGV